jgi:hypothetical protein
VSGKRYVLLLQKGAKDIPVAAIRHKLGELDWLRLDDSKWIIYGDTSASDIYERVKPVLEPKDTFIVFAAPGEYKGFMSQPAVDWLKKPRT